MSYDIWLELEGMSNEEPGNITYNVDPMFALALGGAPAEGVQNARELLIDRKDGALKRFIGKRAGEILATLDDMVIAMEAHPDVYRALNPENGWGNYEGALNYIRRFRDACAESPSAIVNGWL